MTNIKPLKTTRDECSESVINDLQKALSYAKENPQESVIVVMVGRDDNINTFWSAESRLKLLGGIEYAKAKVSDED